MTPHCFRRVHGVLHALLITLTAACFNSPSRAAGVHAEFSVAMDVLLGLGDFSEVSRPSAGGEGAVMVIQDGGGFGLRAAGGMRLLQGYSIPTNEVIFNGTGTQPGKFDAKQSIWWVALGPAWSRPVGGAGRICLHLMGGKALASASSGLGWSDTVGEDPGKTTFTFTQAGITWSPPSGRVDIGADLFAGGTARYWDNPPVVEDGSGNHVLQSRSAPYKGLTIRMGYHFGG